MDKNKLIIIEGCQGAGKTSLIGALKNELPYAQILKLSGNPERNISHSNINHTGALNFVHSVRQMGYDFLLDRAFFTEACYSNLYGDGQFLKEYYPNLVYKLLRLGSYYDIHLVLLIPTNTFLIDSLKKHNEGKKQFSDVKFDVSNSMIQNMKYEELFRRDFSHESNVQITLLSVDGSKTPKELACELLGG